MHRRAVNLARWHGAMNHIARAAIHNEPNIRPRWRARIRRGLETGFFHGLAFLAVHIHYHTPFDLPFEDGAAKLWKVSQRGGLDHGF